MPLVEKEYVTSRKIKHFFMEFPLSMHKNAFKAAEAAVCAGDQGKFWEMHDRLFANPQDIEEEGLFRNAEALGLDLPRFKKCFDGGQHYTEIKKDMAEGQKAGITGTPAFLIGFIQSDGKVKAVKKIVGAQPYAIFKFALDDMTRQITAFRRDELVKKRNIRND